MAAAVTVDEVLRHLGDVDHPADEDAMLAAAERNGASPEVLKAIRAVPPVDHHTANRSLRLDPGPHDEAGEQARTPAPSGVSQASHAPQQGTASRARTAGPSDHSEDTVQIDREHVVQTLRAGGRRDEAKRAEEVLDVQVDTERDADLLRELGIDPDSRAQGGGLALR